MDVLPLGLAVFEVPEGIDRAAADRHAIEVIQRHLETKPFQIYARHALGVPPATMADLRSSVHGPRIREATQRMLRTIGEDGDPLIAGELAYHFIWAENPDPEFGTVLILYVVPQCAVLWEAMLCLQHLGAGAKASVN